MMIICSVCLIDCWIFVKLWLVYVMFVFVFLGCVFVAYGVCYVFDAV